MDRALRVVIYGHSIFVLAIEAGLAALPGVDVIRFDTLEPDAADRIAGLEPDVVIAETGDGNDGLVLGLLERGLPLIGLDEAASLLSLIRQHRLPVEGVQGRDRAIGSVAGRKRADVVRRTRGAGRTSRE